VGQSIGGIRTRNVIVSICIKIGSFNFFRMHNVGL